MNTATKYGNYCALIGISILLICHYVISSAYVWKEVTFLSTFFIEVIFIFSVIRIVRDRENGGYLDFKNSAKAGITMVLVNVIILTLFQYIYYQFIDITFMGRFLPEFEKYSKIMGRSDAAIKADLERMSDGSSAISIAWSSFSLTLFIETIIALIAARILRKNPPQGSATSE